MRVPVSKAKTHFHALVRQAKAGEEIILTYRGEPVAQIEPIERATTPQNTTTG